MIEDAVKIRMWAIEKAINALSSLTNVFDNNEEQDIIPLAKCFEKYVKEGNE